jgi:DNA-binding response OmpR family regulator
MSKQTAHIPIIILTDFPSTRDEAFAAGCDAFATKPIAFAKLRKLIDDLLERHPNAKTNASFSPGTVSTLRYQ